MVTDEVYEHLTFDGRAHVPIATLPGMFDRTVTISSSGKTFSFTGWKIGWATGPADLVAAVEGAKNWLSYSSGAPFQPAIAHALDHEDAFHEQLRDDLSQRRDHICAALEDLGMEVHVPQGTYFVTTDVSTFGYADGLAFCAGLAERARVVAIPSQVFYEDGSDEGRHLVRWAFCKERDADRRGHPPPPRHRPARLSVGYRIPGTGEACTAHRRRGLRPGCCGAPGGGRGAGGRRGGPGAAARGRRGSARRSGEPGTRAAAEQRADGHGRGDLVRDADREGEGGRRPGRRPRWRRAGSAPSCGGAR